MTLPRYLSERWTPTQTAWLDAQADDDINRRLDRLEERDHEARQHNTAPGRGLYLSDADEAYLDHRGEAWD